jgi:sugar lactone lactonase YvrE
MVTWRKRTASRFGVLQVAGVVAGLILTCLPSTAMQGDTIADRVLGQPDFTHNALSAVSASEFNAPAAVAIDTSVTPNRLYIGDTGNNRVLGYLDAASFANGAEADLVVGQADFVSSGVGLTANNLNSPQGVAVDGGGNLYVSDFNNNRVLEYNDPFAACQSFPCVAGPANLVFGQDGFTAGGCNRNGAASADTLCNPQGLALDAEGDLYVADENNSRVLVYNLPLSTDTTADLVIGQADFQSIICSFNLSAKSMCFADAVALDAAGNLYVADNGDDRVLEFKAPLSNNMAAIFEVGQPNFQTAVCSGPARSPDSAQTLCAPWDLAVDGVGNLYVADLPSSRVLEYTAAIATRNKKADVVFGQNGKFTTDICSNGTHGHAVSAEGLCMPAAIALDTTANLYIADTNNNRVLEYDQPIPQTASPTPSSSPTPDGAKISAPSKVSLKPVGIGSGASSTAKVIIRNIGKPGALVGTIMLNNNQPGTAFILSAPGAFDVPEHGTLMETVTFMPDAATDSATLVIESNDPTRGTLNIPVSGTGLPGRLSMPKTLTIASTGVGVQGTASLTLRNVGKGVLVASVPAATLPFVGGGESDIHIAPGESSAPIAIAFTPASTSEVIETLHVTIDAPGTGDTTVTLKGVVKK